MWEITTLLSHLDKLPPAAQEYWKTNFNIAPPPTDEKKEAGEKRDHH